MLQKSARVCAIAPRSASATPNHAKTHMSPSSRWKLDGYTAGIDHGALVTRRHRVKLYAESGEGVHKEEAGAPAAPQPLQAKSKDPERTSSSFASILGIVNQRKQLSLQQRYRALILTLQAYARQNALIQRIAASIDGILAPIRVQKASLDAKFAAFMEDYEQYLAMETKARWSWEKRHRKEMALLASIPPFIGMTIATIIYEIFVPCSVGVAVVLPLYLSWVLYDRWYLSPIVLGMLGIARWKFALRGFTNGGDIWSWLWPGII